MDMDCLKKHAIFHRGLESHTSWGPQGAEQLELFLKTLALFYRSIVVADSDLNNNSVFFELMQQPNSILHDAITSGFLRRAVRAVKPDGASTYTPATQQSIFSAFKKNSPERAAFVSEDHPQTLDRLFERVENAHQPFLWTVDQLSGIFGMRLVVELARAKSQLSLEEQRLIDKVIDYVFSLPDAQTLRAAVLEKVLFAEKESSPAQHSVWDLVLQAYDGNVALSFDLMLGEPADGQTNVIPSGPEASDEQMALAADYYEGIFTSREALHGLFLVSIEQVTPQYDQFLWRIDPAQLCRLSFSQIEEFRESAEPDRFFDLRFETLGSSDKLANNVGELWHELNLYGEKLVQRGIALPASPAEQEASQTYNNIILEKREQGGGSQASQGVKIIAGSTFSSAPKVVSAEVTLADFKSLMNGLDENVEPIPFYYTLKRPNLSVINRVSEQIPH